MENLIFSLQATIPIFLLMVLGYIFHKMDLFDDVFVSKINRFVFVIALPIMLFRDLATQDFSKNWDGTYVFFCFMATLLSIGIAAFLSLFLKVKEDRGEFIQGTYRSSAAILGIAFISNIYGNSGMAPLMIIGTVPLYNIFAVIVLTKQEGMIQKTIINILKNPIIIGIASGFLWSILKFPYPVILNKTTGHLADLATPLGLMAMGGSLNFHSIKRVVKPALVATLLKLFGFVSLFLPLAVYFGFTSSKLVGILVMLGSATTVSSFVMAKNMGHEGTLSSAIVMLTTLVSAFSLTFWLYLLKSIGCI